jgi:hypothetical protein
VRAARREPTRLSDDNERVSSSCAAIHGGRTRPGLWLSRPAPSDAGPRRTGNGMDTIMVTGGLGFTGRHIAARLTAGGRSVVSYNRVFAPSEDGVAMVQG